ncbi:MAG: hypothetical protein IPN33_12725 [Saprospiraceae bacterium]|nr:hypothetical protein [Saprospiraceae bacterium]
MKKLIHFSFLMGTILCLFIDISCVPLKGPGPYTGNIQVQDITLSTMQNGGFNNSPSGILMAISASGTEYAIGPAASWSILNGNVMVDHIAAANQEGQLMTFYKYEGINWKAVNVFEKTKEKVAIERPCAWFLEEDGVTKERVAVPSPSGDVLVFSWHTGSDWTVENVSSITHIKVQGALTAWVVANGNKYVEHVAGRAPNNDLIVCFRQTNGQWSSVNVTQLTSQKIGDAPISWTDGQNPVVEKLAVISPNKEVLIFYYTPATNWTVSNITQKTNQQIDSRMAQWNYGNNKSTVLAGKSPNGELMVFRHEPIDNVWIVENVSQQTSNKILSEVCDWMLNSEEHIAARGPNDELLVFSHTTGFWKMDNVTGVTGKKIFHAPTCWTSKEGSLTIEHISSVGTGKRMFDFFWKPRHNWQVVDVSVNASGRVLYGVAQKGGVWRSDDYSVRWKQCAQIQPPPGKDPANTLNVPVMTDVVVSPENANLVLAATGTDFRKPSANSTGVYRSLNGGTDWQLVFQFHCDGMNKSASQLLFDPLNHDRIYAAGGCEYIAYSDDGGGVWDTLLVDPSGESELWHVAISDKPRRNRGIAAAGRAGGSSIIWYSPFDKEQWTKWDTGFPDNCCGSTVGADKWLSSLGSQNNGQIMTFIPGTSDEIFLVAPLGVQSIPNGPTYWSATINDGDKCCGGPNCKEEIKCGYRGTIWKGNLTTGTFSQLPGPPIYSTGDYSGVIYVYTQNTDNGYLLFFSDDSKVHVSEGMPTNNSWHRLCGVDASESKRSGKRDQFVHVDPHDLAVSPDFNLTLKASDQPSPYNMNFELNKYLLGRIWMANDGGIYLSEDGGQTWSSPEYGPNNQHLINIVGIPGSSTLRYQPPSLYFGATHNDDFFSPDGGQTWYDAAGGCGDCDAWFVDPAQKRVLRLMPRSNLFDIWTGKPGANPDARNNPDINIPYPEGINKYAVSWNVLEGARPLVLTMPNEQSQMHGDYFTIMELYKKDANGSYILVNKEKVVDKKVLIRAKNTCDKSGRTDAFSIVGDTLNNKKTFLPNSVDVYQASGGHSNPSFFVGDGISLWVSLKNANGELDSWDKIVPGNGANQAIRFFANPYNPDEIYLLDNDGIKRTDNGGLQWWPEKQLDSLLTEGGNFLYAETRNLHENKDASILNDMIFYRENNAIRFAMGIAGVFYSQDGKYWTRILDVRAMPGRPIAGWYDPYTNPTDKSLYVAFHSRGLVRLHPIY